MTRTLSPAAVLELSGGGLTLADAGRLLHGHVEALRVAPAARKRVERSRGVVLDHLGRGDTLYGVNTGFGKLAHQRIEPHEVLALQENLLRSHAVGLGGLLPLGVARLAFALRLQALAKGYSGVTPELIEALIAVYNRGVVPAIPEQGSVGASGDLAPLAHLALVVIAILSLWPGDDVPSGTGWDKANHLLAFLALAVMARLGYPARPFLQLGLWLLAYGGLIEILQSMTPTRYAEWADLAADALGIALGAVAVRWWRRVSA